MKATIASGLESLTQGAARLFQAGSVNQTAVMVAKIGEVLTPRLRAELQAALAR